MKLFCCFKRTSQSFFIVAYASLLIIRFQAIFPRHLHAILASQICVASISSELYSGFFLLLSFARFFRFLCCCCCTADLRNRFILRHFYLSTLPLLMVDAPQQPAFINVSLEVDSSTLMKPGILHSVARNAVLTHLLITQQSANYMFRKTFI